MAKPMKETPKLEGKFARELIISMEKNSPDPEKASYLQECRTVYKAISQV